MILRLYETLLGLNASTLSTWQLSNRFPSLLRGITVDHLLRWMIPDIAFCPQNLATPLETAVFILTMMNVCSRKFQSLLLPTTLPVVFSAACCTHSSTMG